MSDSENEGGVPLLEPEFDTSLPDKKRKRDDNEPLSPETKKANKKAKKKEKKKARQKDIKEDDLDQELGVNHAFERMDSQLLADYVNARTRHYGKDLSSVELEEMFIPSMRWKLVYGFVWEF
jgi:protein CMS1